MTGVDDAAASPTAAAKFEEPPSESEVAPSDKSKLPEMPAAAKWIAAFE